MNGTPPIVFGLTPQMITSPSISRERRKPFMLPFPVIQFLEYIGVPTRHLIFILITLKKFKIFGYFFSLL